MQTQGSWRGIAGRGLSGAVLGAALTVAVTASVAEAGVIFTRIVDTNTPIPGGMGNFTDFAVAPAFDDGVVAFRGIGAGQEGIYVANSVLTRVADLNTSIPSGTGTFADIGNPSLSGGQVGFLGSRPATAGGSAVDQLGIYAGSGSLSRIADRTTTVPETPQTFATLGPPAIDGGNVAFLGSSPPFSGLYADFGGLLSKVADRNTAIPDGTGNFTDFLPLSVSIDGNDVAFQGRGSGAQQGIYSTVGGLHRVADLDTPIPGGTGNFTDFGTFPNVSLDGGEVAFRGLGSGSQEGIYATMGGLHVIADRNTLMPGGAGNFSGFGIPSLDGGNVAFVGGGGGIFGIYILLDGLLQTVIDSNDLLDGMTVQSFQFGKEGLSGHSLAFRAIFTDGSEAIYRADLIPTDVPEPGSLALLALGFAGLGLARRRRRVSDRPA